MVCEKCGSNNIEINIQDDSKLEYKAVCKNCKDVMFLGKFVDYYEKNSIPALIERIVTNRKVIFTISTFLIFCVGFFTGFFQ